MQRPKVLLLMKTYINLILFTACALFTITPALAEDWIAFQSESALYTSKMLDNVIEKNDAIPVLLNAVAYSGQATSEIDQRPYKNAVKRYTVKIDQTIGAPLRSHEIGPLIDKELKAYTDYYTNLGGVLKKKDANIYHHNLHGGEVYIQYKDPEFGDQSIRARVLFTGTSKFQQIITGPDSMMNAYSSKAFFDSMNVTGGYHMKPEAFGKNMQEMPSPLGIFTAYIPQQTPSFMPAQPVVKNTQNVEKMGMRFIDPVSRSSVLYNIYGYKIGKNLSSKSALNLLQQKHIRKHRASYKHAGSKSKEHAVSIRNTKNNNGITTFSTEYPINPLQGFSDMDRVKLHARFVGDTMIVHEVIGARRLVSSPLIRTIREHVAFHPEVPKESLEEISLDKPADSSN